jgi:hypothetical protein
MLMNGGYQEEGDSVDALAMYNQGGQVSTGVSAYDLYNRPHNYIKVALPVRGARAKKAITGGRGGRKGKTKASAYRRKF